MGVVTWKAVSRPLHCCEVVVRALERAIGETQQERFWCHVKRRDSQRAQQLCQLATGKVLILQLICRALKLFFIGRVGDSSAACVCLSRIQGHKKCVLDCPTVNPPPAASIG